MREELVSWSKGCWSCQKIKKGKKWLKPNKLQLFPAREPFEMVSIDIVGPMPIDEHGNRYIVSFIDRFSRFCRLVPVKSIRTIDIMHAVDDWISLFGPPRYLLSDNGSQFVSYLFRDFAASTGIKLKTTTVYHPETNGMVERLHRWVKERLALLAYDGGLNFVDGTDAWSDYINLISFAYNSTPNRMNKLAPSTVVFGRNPARLEPLNEDELDPKTPSG